jgi:hypothetical protein
MTANNNKVCTNAVCKFGNFKGYVTFPAVEGEIIEVTQEGKIPFFELPLCFPGEFGNLFIRHFWTLQTVIQDMEKVKARFAAFGHFKGHG